MPCACALTQPSPAPVRDLEEVLGHARAAGCPRVGRGEDGLDRRADRPGRRAGVWSLRSSPFSSRRCRWTQAVGRAGSGIGAGPLVEVAAPAARGGRRLPTPVPVRGQRGERHHGETDRSRSRAISKAMSISARHIVVHPTPPLTALELDLADHPGGDSGGDHTPREALGDHRVRSDHAALADLHPAGHDAVDPEPAVGPDPDRALGGEPLPGDRDVGVVEAMVRVADEAAVGEHHVVADLESGRARPASPLC